MVKYLKRILLFSAIFFVLLLGGVAYLLSLKPVLITPYTYIVHEKVNKGMKEAENSDVLIIGDRMGLYLNNFVSIVKDDFRSELKRDLNIYNWSREKEGLHRTLNKIKSLKKLPPIIIYQGGSYEWFDKKFDWKDKKKILYNFEQFSDEKIISMIITFPDISRAIYKKTAMFELDTLNPKLRAYQESNFDAKEIEYKFYEQELHELVDYIKQKKSNIILLTTPINALVPPRESCTSTSSNLIVEFQQEIENLIKEGNNKEAYAKIQELEKQSMGNAKTFYLLGMAARLNADYKNARDAFIKANVYDCYNWRANDIFNAIINRISKRMQVEVIDFQNEILNTQMQEDAVFIDEIYPQNLYYNNLMKELTLSIKKYLNIK